VLEAWPALAEQTRRLGWTAPLEHDGFAEPRDAEFLRAIGYEDLAGELAAFWPTRGPVWDALAVTVPASGRHGVVLAEGKSYPAELYSGGTKATEPSRSRIVTAIEWTQQQLGLAPDADTWLGPLYQSANRIAHVCWLRAHGVDAWLVHLLFTDDRTHKSASRDEWERGLAEADELLRITNVDVPWLGHSFLPALASDELTRSPTYA
jgi:hypothetical protein